MTPPGVGDGGRRSGLLGIGEAVASAALRPVTAGVALGPETERRLRGAAMDD